MPSYVWVCECGEKFPDTGDNRGWNEALGHQRLHEQNSEPERIRGLFDVQTGEMVFQGGSRLQAVAQGVLSKKKPAATPSKDVFQGKVILKEIPIDPGVILCFYEAQERWPHAYPDDSPATISKFITECVFGFYRLCRDELTMGKLLDASLRAILEEQQGQIEKKAIGVLAAGEDEEEQA